MKVKCRAANRKKKRGKKYYNRETFRTSFPSEMRIPALLFVVFHLLEMTSGVLLVPVQVRIEYETHSDTSLNF